MAKTENKKDEGTNAGSGASTSNANTSSNITDQGTASASGETKKDDEPAVKVPVKGDKDFDESFDKSYGKARKIEIRVGMPVMFLPSVADEVCRNNGATVNIAFCTAVFGGDKINLQAVPDGGSLQWRTTIDHKSNAAEGADAWCHMHEHEEFKQG